MIVKLLLKIAFKFTLPLVAIVGVVSYMLYTNGADPLQMAKSVASKASIGQFSQGSALAGFASKASNSVSGAFGSITNGLNTAFASDSASSITVYRWVDPDGSTQYGPTPGSGATQIKTINLSKAPNVHSQTTASNASATNDLAVQGISLPGGVKLPEAIDYSRILGQIEE